MSVVYRQLEVEQVGEVCCLRLRQARLPSAGRRIAADVVIIHGH